MHEEMMIMSIRTWSDDYASGFPALDAQHKRLFEMINTFATKNAGSMSRDISIEFLNNLEAYCIAHFGLEEQMMAENDYPLTEYHTDIHKNLKQTVEEVKAKLEKDELKGSFTTVVNFATDWLNNHIAQDDLAFSSYCQNKDYDLGQQLLGRICEVLTMDNRLLGSGKIESVDKNSVVISNASKTQISANLNDMVKISSLSEKQETQSFLAKVYSSTVEELKLFNASTIQTENHRKFFRVPTSLKATLRFDDKVVPVTITDISAGGMMIESKQMLELDQFVSIDFVVQNNRLIELCNVKRVIKDTNTQNIYGLQFAAMNSSNSGKINSFVFNKQTSARRKLRLIVCKLDTVMLR